MVHVVQTVNSVIPLPLQSTRLGKYINQVRRTISDKTLAKRMKRLVIQWRSLAQKSPTSSATNGVPCTSPSVADAIQPITATSVSKPTPNSISVSLQPPVITSLINPHPTPSATSALQPPTLQPPSAPSLPPTSNPTSHRKRLLHRLSTVKFSSNLPPSTPQSGAQPTQGSLSSRQHSSSPSPPSNTSVNHILTRSPSPPQPLLPVASDTPVSPSLPPPAPPTQVSIPSSIPSSTASCLVSVPPSSAGAVASSLPVRLPFNSVAERLVVQIPLAHATPSNTSNTSPATNHSAEVAPPTAEGAWHRSGKEARKLSEKKPRCLVVRISRLLVNRPEDGSGAVTEEARPLSPVCMQLASPVEPAVLYNEHTSLPLHEEGPECSVSVLDTSTPVPSPGQQVVPLGLCPGVHGCYGLDGLWYNWTDPIIRQDFAVNVLPYVYIDGMQDT